jgi:hypothetical protein
MYSVGYESMNAGFHTPGLGTTHDDARDLSFSGDGVGASGPSEPDSQPNIDIEHCIHSSPLKPCSQCLPLLE